MDSRHVHLITFILRRTAARREARAFEEAMARMAADPAIWTARASIAREFASADGDGLQRVRRRRSRPRKRAVGGKSFTDD